MPTNKPDLLYTSTSTRINDRWFIKDNQLHEIVDNFSADTKFRNFDDNYTHNKMDNALYQQCFLQVVTETVFNYPMSCFTEKSAKPLLNKRPFVMVGAPGSLANLKSIGFKTFSDFWSEDYDTIADPELRIMAIVDIIEWVCAQSVTDLQSLCVRMKDVLNYNFTYYVNEFEISQLIKLEQACIENLKPRYD